MSKDSKQTRERFIYHVFNEAVQATATLLVEIVVVGAVGTVVFQMRSLIAGDVVYGDKSVWNLGLKDGGNI